MHRLSVSLACLTLALASACGGGSASGGDGDGDGDATAAGGSGGTLPGGSGGAATGGTSMGTGGGTMGTGGSTTIPNTPPNWTVTGISTWRNDAAGAYTIFHDDTCNGSVDHQLDQADPALFERGLVASFGAIAQDCVERDLWDELEVLLAHGHEVANHSYSHANLADDGADINQEIDQAHTILNDNLSKPVSYYIFPYDSFTDGLLQHLRDLGYLGARAGERGINSADFSDDHRINFDVYGPGYSIYVGAEGSPCSSVEGGADWDSTSQGCRAYVMNQYVEDIIDQGGYGIRELHGLDGEGWEPIPLAEYETHLDFLVSKISAGELWVTTASDAIRYRRGREACTGATVAGDSLYFETVSEACLKFATTLSYEITSLGQAPTAVTATQGGQPVNVVSLGAGSFRVNADPSKGPLVLVPN